MTEGGNLSKGLINYLLSEGPAARLAHWGPCSSLVGVLSSLTPMSSKEGPQPPQLVLGQCQW